MRAPDLRPRVAYVRGSYLNPVRDAVSRADPGSLRHHGGLSALASIRREPARDAERAAAVPRLSQRARAAPHRRAVRFPICRRASDTTSICSGSTASCRGLQIAHAAEQTFYCSYQLAQRKARYGYKLICLQAEINPFWADGHGNVLERAEFVRKTRGSVHRALRARTQRPAVRRRRARAHPRDRPRHRHQTLRAGAALRRAVPEVRDRAGQFRGAARRPARVGERASTASRTLRDWCYRIRPSSALNPVFVYAGDGPERGGLERRLQRLGIEKSFRLIGSQPYSRLPDIHRLADVFVLPSIATRTVQEQFGIALIEAMA